MLRLWRARRLSRVSIVKKGLELDGMDNAELGAKGPLAARSPASGQCGVAKSKAGLDSRRSTREGGAIRRGRRRRA